MPHAAKLCRPLCCRTKDKRQRTITRHTMQKAYANRISYWDSHGRTMGDKLRVLRLPPPTNLIIRRLHRSWSQELGTKSQDKWHCWISSRAIAVCGYLESRVRTAMATGTTGTTGTTGRETEYMPSLHEGNKHIVAYKQRRGNALVSTSGT